MSPTPYSENNPNHVPNPLYQTGVVDTTGTTGDTGARIENISPAFAEHKAAAFKNAVEAIDDPNVDENRLVVFHDGEDGHLSREDAIQKLRDAAQDASENPQLDDPGQTPAAQEAAQEVDEDDDVTNSDYSSDGTFGDKGTAEVDREEGRVGDTSPSADQQNANTDGLGGGFTPGEPDTEPTEGDAADSSNVGASEDKFPLDIESKAKWVAYAERNGLDVDQGLSPKSTYVDRVKAAKAAKDASA